MANGKDAKDDLRRPAAGHHRSGNREPRRRREGSRRRRQGQGRPGTSVAPCKWKLNIKVHSNERFWPKDAFQVLFGAVKAGGAKDNIPPVDPAWYLSGIKDAEEGRARSRLWGLPARRTAASPLSSTTSRKRRTGSSPTAPDRPKLLADQHLPESIDNGQEHKLDLYVGHR